MFTITKNNFILKSLILSLPITFLLFGAQDSTFKSQNVLYPLHHSNSCCKNCGDENCNYCVHHKEHNSNKPDNCRCQVSKDLDEKPISLPNSFKYVDYYQFHTTFTFPADFKLYNFAFLKFSIEHINSFNEDASTVLRI